MNKLKSLLNEFKKFAMRGNVVDLAIGLTVGAGFKEIVTSFVDDIIMPPVGLILGKVSFDNLYINLSRTKYESLDLAEKAGIPIIKYGNFLNTIIDFVIVALVIFMVVKVMNELEKKEETKKKPNTKKCPYCFTDINDQATRCPNCTSKL